MKNKIGIHTKGLNNKIGSLFVGIVVVKPNFFRKNHISDGPIPNNASLEHFYIYKISPRDIKKQIQIYELQGIISCLNTYHQFWKHDIFINCSAPETFRDLIPGRVSKGLKNIDLKINKWTIGNNISNQLIKLTKKMVIDYYNEEQEYIKKVYGDYKNEDEFIKNNPNNPYIRENLKEEK